MSAGEAIFEQGRTHRVPGAAALRVKIGATIAILAAQFWGLTATLAAWQSQNAGALRWLLPFQAVCTLAAIAIGRSRRQPALMSPRSSSADHPHRPLEPLPGDHHYEARSHQERPGTPVRT